MMMMMMHDDSVLVQLRSKKNTQPLTLSFHNFFFYTFNAQPLDTMSTGNVDWDSKLVIGKKAKAPKVTKNETDLNGTSDATIACHVELDTPSLLS